MMDETNLDTTPRAYRADSRQIGDLLEARDRAWPFMDAEHRAEARRRHYAAGWTSCGHAECPPWGCNR